jgi:hypothetical protein
MPNLLGVYPVNTVNQIKEASRYFDENVYALNHHDRVSYARELASILHQEGMELTDKVAQYSGPPREDFSAGFHIRYKYTKPEHHDKLSGIQKLAGHISPDEASSLLDDFDHRTGLSATRGRWPDAHETFFYNEKTASADMPDDVWRGSTDSLRRSKLESWVQSAEYYGVMKKHFPIDLVQSMRENVWPIFSSLPDPHKQIISRLCNDTTYGMHPNTQSMYDVGGAIDKSELHRPANQMHKELQELHDQKARIVRAVNRR